MYLQIRDRGRVDLFRSHHPDFRDGEQLRDFIYVKDVVEVCSWIMNAKPASGIYNLGTGKARSFLDLARATFAGMDLKPDIRFIDMPPDIRDKYQYFTEADTKKLRQAGYGTAFRSLEEGVGEYVREYLRKGLYY
jgi:ADP-L-glycero-D-manno-heptose 6-epimerase